MEMEVVSNQHAPHRKKEIFDLMKDNVDFNKRVIHVTNTKNWKVRDIPMNDLLTKTLKEVIQNDSSDSPYVFTSNRTGEAFKDIKNGFNRAAKVIGLKRFRFHDLRHTWCLRLCELGIDESTIMKLGGWKTRSMID
jgi:integrase